MIGVKHDTHPTISSSGLLPSRTEKECPCCLMPARMNNHTIATCPIGLGKDNVNMFRALMSILPPLPAQVNAPSLENDKLLQGPGRKLAASTTVD